MKRMRPSPALVISLIALFVALGGTTYAAISLPRNSVGTTQLKNGAVTAAKLRSSVLRGYLKSSVLKSYVKSSVLKGYVKYGSTLPSGVTETGDWAYGNYAGSGNGGSRGYQYSSFPVPLAKGLNAVHTIYVSDSSATHCPGVGHADPGYLCVYETDNENANTPSNANILDPEADGSAGAGRHGWAIYVTASGPNTWFIGGSYAVTAR